MKNKRKRLTVILIFLSVMISCEKTGVIKESDPISDVHFHYLQASNKFFISAYASSQYQGSNLDSLMVLWQGVSSADTADTIRLFDNGTKGDMIKNIIPSSAKDSIFFSIMGLYGGKSVSQSLIFLLGNIRPKIGTVVVPDTVLRPAANPDPNIYNTIKFSVTATVSDPNGIDDIKRVFFRSYHVGKDSLMNGGNPILLYDDGEKDSSGDLQKGDGKFSRTISINENALVGIYHWTFEAQDLSSAYSDTVKKVLVVE